MLNIFMKNRDFFIQISGDKNFKFTADIVATAKIVKNINDKVKFIIENKRYFYYNSHSIYVSYNKC